nr:hypothetical protein [Pseudozobellia thermophila]
MSEPWHYYLMATLYVVAGLNHFIRPKIYKRIIPPYLPKATLLVYASGAAEVFLGMALLFEPLKKPALYGIVFMLIAFLPVHFYMLHAPKASMGLPKWSLVLRILLQFVLMYWAYTYLG